MHLHGVPSIIPVTPPVFRRRSISCSIWKVKYLAYQFQSFKGINWAYRLRKQSMICCSGCPVCAARSARYVLIWSKPSWIMSKVASEGLPTEKLLPSVISSRSTLLSLKCSSCGEVAGLLRCGVGLFEPLHNRIMCFELSILAFTWRCSAGSRLVSEPSVYAGKIYQWY